ncbi:MAG TPA: chalcone isomerase family protein [Thermoanaerobaculaceae bacterium]|nr:chalcone isomerase family protein [Thermoanaerobaculaceae bacterium]
MRLQTIACVALALAAVPTAAMELAGVTLPDTTTVNGTTLKLNGMGIRTKTMLKVKVYVAGLYLATPSHDAAAIIAADEPKQVVMHFLYEKVEKDKLTEAWQEGFANNSASTLPALKARLDEFCGFWPDMASGEEAAITYIPGTGTKLEIKGKEAGVIAGKDFADAMFAVWLGPKPADAGLKTGVLGK